MLVQRISVTSGCGHDPRHRRWGRRCGISSICFLSSTRPTSARGRQPRESQHLIRCMCAQTMQHAETTTSNVRVGPAWASAPGIAPSWRKNVQRAAANAEPHTRQLAVTSMNHAQAGRNRAIARATRHTCEPFAVSLAAFVPADTPHHLFRVRAGVLALCAAGCSAAMSIFAFRWQLRRSSAKSRHGRVGRHAPSQSAVRWLHAHCRGPCWMIEYRKSAAGHVYVVHAPPPGTHAPLC